MIKNRKMVIQELHIINLLQKYLKNQCNEEELRILLEWLKSTEDYKSFDVVDEALRTEVEKMVFTSDDKHLKELHAEVSVLLEKARAKELFALKKNRNNRNIWSVVAAVAVLIGIFWGMGHLLHSKSDKVVSYKVIVALRGERKVLTLPDGSRLTLNSESKVYIPDNFNVKNRSLKMTGEVFFQVTHNEKKPFVVMSNGAVVEDLGTSFNVKSYKEDEDMSVTVSTGKVRVNIQNQDLQLALSPNEHLIVNRKNGAVTKEKLSDNNYNEWMKGVLYFNNTPIEEVIRTINRVYNSDLVLEKNNVDMKISGKHDNKNLHAVVEAVCFATGLKTRKENNKIILY